MLENDGGRQMAKGKSTIFFCQNCGYESAKWMGQCPACREWNSFAEETVQKAPGAKISRRTTTAEPVSYTHLGDTWQPAGADATGGSGQQRVCTNSG